MIPMHCKTQGKLALLEYSNRQHGPRASQSLQLFIAQVQHSHESRLLTNYIPPTFETSICESLSIMQAQADHFSLVCCAA
jgi:hypothetical protein